MSLNRKLIKHPTKNGLFIETHNDYQTGHSLYTDGHIFTFSSKSIDVSESLSSYSPLKFDQSEREIDEVKISTSESIFLELECNHPYSYMGSDRKIERYTMWIDDLSDQKLQSPHIEVVAHYDDEGGNDITLGVGLYVEQKQLQKIREGFISEKYNYIDVSFSTEFNCDLVFKSSSVFNYPPNDFLKSFGLDQKKYGRVNTPYPYKILQKYFDIGDEIYRYEGQPFTNFNIKFGKKVMNDKVSFEEDPNIEKIRQLMTYELLTLNGDEDNET
tara:strand:+ start:426 stop:1241 length:816 start_codon:yes stop_codon:yes gene_type:complete